MPVTFAAAGADPTAWRVVCADDTVLATPDDEPAAYAAARAHGGPDTPCAAGAHLCQEYGADVRPVWPAGLDPVELNNRNAGDLLTLLGLPPALDPDADPLPLGITAPPGDGQLAAGDLLARIDIACAVGYDDAGLTEINLSRHIDAGRRPGYLAEKLALLRTLAATCAVLDLPVRWF